MNIWSHIRAFIYSAAIVALSLTTISLSVFIGSVEGVLLMIISLFMTAKISMFAGHKHADLIYSNKPLDKNYSHLMLGIGVIGAAILQFATSYAHYLYNPVLASDSLIPDNLSLFLRWLLIGLMFPIFEEVGFRQILWNNLKNALSYIGTETNIITPLAFIITTFLFVIAHIPSQGTVNSLFLIPIAMFLGMLRWRTRGIFICSMAHITFNTISVFIS